MIVFYAEGKNVQRFVSALHTTIIANPVDTFKICVPSFVYIVQNNLLYLSATHLDAATYQVTYQLKILTTAVFAVGILRKRLIRTQWLALFVLVLGVVFVQLADDGSASASPAQGAATVAPVGREQNRLVGFAAALGACFLSGFAGIYFEKMLKGADISVWLRNVQLSLLSVPFGLLTCLVNDYGRIRADGFFHGYDLFVCYLVVLQAGGGLIVAMVVKFADNILKGFATSLAIIISAVASVYLFEFRLTVQFTVGAALVIGSIFLYGYDPNAGKSKPSKSVTNRRPSDSVDDEERGGGRDGAGEKLLRV